ncbi:MAG: arylamine N-acetyltransferase, partial [Actinophytocola sp.]
VRVPTAQRRLADRVTIVRACTLTRTDAGGSTVAVVDRRADWFALLADEFGLTFEGAAPAALDRLWDTVRAAHEAHTTARQP